MGADSWHRNRENDSPTTLLVAQKAPGRTDSSSVFLIVLTGVDVGQVFPLNAGATLIGRDDDAHIKITDPGLSRRHALVFGDPASSVYNVRDLESRNGTRVNGEPVDRGGRPLRAGDKIDVGGQTVLRFSLGGEPETVHAQEMQAAALRDGLTQTFNRRYLDQRLVSEIAFALRHRTPLSLLIADIDHFKSINDEHGHPWGDAILKGMCALLAKRIRTEDVLARYGGEEFAILCRDTDVTQATILAERLRKAVSEQRYEIEDVTIRLTVSLGVAELLDCGFEDVEALIKAADEALYQAKHAGRNRVVRYVPAADSDS